MNGRTCWIVQPEILERYSLSNLSAVNSWSAEPKKRSRKADETKNEGDTPPPPSKTARVSLMKKFVSKPVAASPSQPIAKAAAAGTSNSPEPTAPVEPSLITPKGKKRVALISLPSSSTKKPRNETKATPLTSFLKKMGSGKDASLKPPSRKHEDGAMNDDDCVVLE